MQQQLRRLHDDIYASLVAEVSFVLCGIAAGSNCGG